MMNKENRKKLDMLTCEAIIDFSEARMRFNAEVTPPETYLKDLDKFLYNIENISNVLQEEIKEVSQ